MMKWMKEHDVLLRLFSLLIAILLWAYVMSTRNITKTNEYRGIPVQMENLSQLTQNDLIILEGSNNTVTVKVSGDMSNISAMSREYITATASVASVSEPGTYQLNYRVSIDAPGVTLVSKTPTQITVVVDRMTSVSVPVEVEFLGELPEGCTVSSFHASPDAITVRGPESVLKDIQTAKVVYDLANLTTSTQTNVAYTLLDQNGKEVSDSHLVPATPSTTLSINVKQNDFIPLTVNLVDDAFLKESMVHVSIEPESVQVAGNPDVVRELNQIQLGSIDLGDVLKNDKTVFELPLLLPNGISSADAPEKAVVTITFSGYSRKTLLLDEKALPEDSSLVYPEQEIEVQALGTDDTVETLSADQIRLTPVYDVNSLVVGENIVPCKVECDNAGVYFFTGTQVIASITEEALEALKATVN